MTGIVSLALSVNYVLHPVSASGPSSNRVLNYQLRLTDTNGIPVADGARNVKFTMYDAAALGTQLWSACTTDGGATSVPTAASITFTNGLGTVLLGSTGITCASGSVVAFPATLFNQTAIYLGVTVGTDPEMSPRKRIVASPFALNADTLDDLDTSAVGGSVAFVPVTDASGNLTLTQNLDVAANTLFVDSASLRVGIGTASPASSLHMVSDGFGANLTVQSATDDFPGIALANNAYSASALLALEGNDLRIESMNGEIRAIGEGEKIMTFHRTGLYATFFPPPVSRTNEMGYLANDGSLFLHSGSIGTPFGGEGRYENRLLYSEQIDNAAWTKVSETVTADAAPAPDGTTTADRVVGSSGSASISQPDVTGAVAGSAAWAGSVWLKVNGLGLSASVNLRIDSDSETGTPVTVTVGREWKRFSVTESSLSSVTGPATFVINNGALGVLVWGAQLEPATELPLPGVYARTGAAAVTAGRGLVMNGPGPHLFLNGNVGIGTTTPGAKLEVVGEVISTGTAWTSRTSAADKSWWSVAFGNGLFVAVTDTGVGNRVMTSPDGVNWTLRSTPADNGWVSVTYGNGLFAAVALTGTGNRVMTSPDGVNWTSRTSAADNDWNSVTFGNGLFVAVADSGAGNRVMTSPDGITWTIRTSAADNQWRSVAYGNGLFVAVASSGAGNRVMTSPDGITWTSRTSAVDNGWRSVTYGNGLFVAAAQDGAGNRVMTSPDGITWTSRTSAANNSWYSVAYGGGMFVAVSSDGIGNRVMTSGKTELNALAHNNTYQGGMNIFGNVGIGTATPTAKLDVAGDIVSSQAIKDAMGWIQNQGGIEKVKLGSNNGSFGGGATPGNLAMKADDVAVYDTTAVNANSKGFQGAVFDGRYVYFAPFFNGVSSSGQVTRYDTTAPLAAVGSYSVFDTTTVNANSKAFIGAVFDGRYVYFVPNNNGAAFGQITRYDTTGSFTAAGSWSVFDTTTVNANSKGFLGAVFDGRYVYFVPFNNGAYFGQITRYDTTASFTAGASYSVFDTTAVDANSKGFRGAVFDGRYVYFVPNNNGAAFGQITRYDTTGSFTAAGSYSVFDTATVNANSKGFAGAVFDGRYVYFVPNNNGAAFGQITRYDTTGSFTAAGSYSVFDTATVNANSKGFQGAIFDGRYVYLAPFNNGATFGQITRLTAWSGGTDATAGLAKVARGSDLYIDSAGRVGIGTMAPDTQLTVGAPATIQGSVFGSVNGLGVSKTFTSFGIASQTQAIWDFAAPGGGIQAVDIDVQTKSGNANNMTGGITALIARAEHLGSGTATTVGGIIGVGSNRGGATATTVYGVRGQSVNLSASTTTNAYALYAANALETSGSITNSVGFVAEDQTVATNNTDVLIGTSTIPVGNYALYNSSAYNNYFAGKVGIGTTVPVGQLEVAHDYASDSLNAVLLVTSYRDASNSSAGAFVGRRARGTFGSPTAAQSGDFIASFQGNGYGATGWSPSLYDGSFQVVATENFTDTAHGTALRFVNTPNGTVSLAERMRINHDGFVGIGDTDPASLLTVGSGDKFMVNADGDVTSNFTSLVTNSTAAAGCAVCTSLVLASSVGFDVGNYVQINSTYAKITANNGVDTLTISPALTWLISQTATEYHIPEIGGTDLASTLTNRYGRGYFIDGIVTGNGSTYITDNKIESGGTFSINSIGNQPVTFGTGTVTIPGVLNVTNTGTSAFSGPLRLANAADPDPSGANGLMYYNTTANKFRCYQNGAWTDCIGAGGGASFVNGGNSFAGAAVMGTNDANSLSLETNNITYLTIANGGGFTLPVDTDWTLTGGVNGLSFDGTTFSVDATNNRIGIGTPSPEYTLDIVTEAQASAQESLNRWRVSDDADAFIEIFNGTTTDGLFAPTIRGRAPNLATRAGLYFVSEILTAYDSGTTPITIFDARRSDGAAVTRPLFSFANYASSKMLIAASGNVGIGDTSPTNTLDVTGSIGISDTAVIDSSRRIFAADGVLGAGTLAYSFSADQNTGIYRGGTDIIKFATAGADRVAIIANGNVGIGDTTPAAPLTVGASDAFQVSSTGQITTSGLIHTLSSSSNVEWRATNAPVFILSNVSAAGQVQLMGSNQADGSGPSNAAVFVSNSGTTTADADFGIIAGGGGGAGTRARGLEMDFNDLTTDATTGGFSAFRINLSALTTATGEKRSVDIHDSYCNKTKFVIDASGNINLGDGYNTSTCSTDSNNRDVTIIGSQPTLPNPGVAVRGGNVTIKGGNAIRNTTGSANGGTVVLDSGALIGAGTATVSIGNTNATAIGIGRAGSTTTLNGTLSINGSLVPSADATYDLGTSANRWRDLYVSGASIHLGTSANSSDIVYDTANDRMEFRPDGANARLVVQDAGNVGIGDITPVSALTVGNGDLFQVNSSGNIVKLNNVTYSWPGSQGGASTLLTNDGSGNLTWTAASSGANTSLSNLASVALNTDLLPAASPSTATANRTLTTVDSSGNVGSSTSIAVPADGLPVISYLDATNGALKVVKCGDAACSAGNTTTTVDSGVVGEYSSIAVSADGLPVISYFDTLNGDLKVAKCGNAACSSGNTITTVDSTGVVGEKTSIAVSADGLPVISYRDFTNLDLKVAKCGNAACSSGNTITTVDSTGNVGINTSIAIGNDGLPVIGYYDGDNIDLKVAKCGNAACSSGNVFTAIESGNSVGDWADITVPADGLPVISYQDVGNSDLKVAKCGNAACSSGNVFTTVDSTGSVGTYTAITVPADGLPVISYYDTTNSDLKVAKCGNAACTGFTLTTVDSSGSVGSYGSIAVPAGSLLPVISYQDITNLDLKVAKCVDGTCAASTTAYSGGRNIGTTGQFFNNVYAANFYGKRFYIEGFDVAESYYVRDATIEAGDLVRIDAPDQGSGHPAVERTSRAHDGAAIGVISTKPGINLSEWSDNGNIRPVALAGRVPVKVNDENGAIGVGDAITSSSVPGVGMKSTRSGRIIGFALQPWDGTGQGLIQVFVNPGWWNGVEVLESNSSSAVMNLPALTIEGDVDLKGYGLLNVGFMRGIGDLWSIDGNGKLTAKEVVADSVTSKDVKIKKTDDMKTVGEGMIKSGEAYAQIQNASVKSGSKVFVTFRKSPRTGWFVDEITDGFFTLKLDVPAVEDVAFDYWIIGIVDETTPTDTIEPPATEQPMAPVEEPIVDPVPVSEPPASEQTPAEEPIIDAAPTEESVQEILPTESISETAP